MDFWARFLLHRGLFAGSALGADVHSEPQQVCWQPKSGAPDCPLYYYDNCLNAKMLAGD